MKKIISLVLSLLFCVTMFVGCSLFSHDYEKDNKQIIATIQSFTQNVSGEVPVFDEDGYPTYEIDGEQIFKKVDADYTSYTSNKVDIYKSQLANYANYYLYNDIQGGKDINTAMESYVDSLVRGELLLIEADKLFYAGVLYWTQADVDEIQRSVYQSITDSIFEIKNALLKDNDLPVIAARGGEPATDTPTYALPPVDEEEVVSPRYDVEPKADDNQWFDAWYNDHEWYIESNNYRNTYPGLYGSTEDRNLATEAFNNYLDMFFERASDIVGISEDVQKEVDEQIDELKKIRTNEGAQYVFPLMGKTLAGKLLIGENFIRNKKLTKLNEYITKEITEVTETDIETYYNNLLKKQIKQFATQSNFDAAVTGGNDTILYYPSDRYVFVKHILLPFSDAQVAKLNKIKTREGDNEEKIIEERAKLAREIEVYHRVNGEDDKTRPPMKVTSVLNEIIGAMDFLKDVPAEAEREFDRLIYKYNTDPGIFGKETGYAVVYKLDEGEKETYMTEFADAARALRDNFNVGELFYDDEITDEKGKPVPYCITDYGIHIMYYLMDPVKSETMYMNSYVTPGRYSRIYDRMKTGALAAQKTGVYDIWEDQYLKDFSDKYLSKQDKIIEKYIKELNDQIPT